MTVKEAAAEGNVELLRVLLEAGGDPNEPETEDHWPPLIEAVYHDHVEAARLLLDAGADMQAPHRGDETPLLMAIQQGSLDVFRLLCERGCRLEPALDDPGWTLTQAASRGHLEIVRWLLAQGLAVDATDHQGCTALTYAAHAGRLEIVEELLRAGADVNHRDEDSETVLMWAADHPGKAAALRALVQAGADVNAKNAEVYDALLWVMSHGKGDSEMVETLLDAGAIVSGTVFERACCNGFAPAVRLLLKQGAYEAFIEAGGDPASLLHADGRHRDVGNLLRQAEAERQLRATGKAYPPPAYPIGAHVRTLAGTPREGWIVLTAWHHKQGAYGYFIEVEGKTQARKNVSRRYWAEELQTIENDPADTAGAVPE